MNRERIDQFIRKEAPRRDVRWNFDGTEKVPGIRVALRSFSRLLAPRCGPLHSHVTQGAVKLWKLKFAEIENVRSEPPHSSAGLDEREFCGTPKVLPHFSKLPGEQPSKNGMNIHAGVVVGKPRGF